MLALFYHHCFSSFFTQSFFSVIHSVYWYSPSLFLFYVRTSTVPIHPVLFTDTRVFCSPSNFYLMNTVIKVHKEKHVLVHIGSVVNPDQKLWPWSYPVLFVPSQIRPFNCWQFIKFYTGSGHIAERIPNPHLTMKELL
jgi:hypothetical protein